LIVGEQGFSLLKARFVTFAYSPHSHETFAIGQKLQGLQDFRCRGISLTGSGSSAGPTVPGV